MKKFTILCLMAAITQAVHLQGDEKKEEAAKLLEIGKWKSDERTQRKLEKLTEHIGLEVATRSVGEAGDSIPVLQNVMSKVLAWMHRGLAKYLADLAKYF